MVKFFRLFLPGLFLLGMTFFAVCIFVLPHIFNINSALNWQPKPAESLAKVETSSKPDHHFALTGPDKCVTSAPKLQVPKPSGPTAGHSAMGSVLKTLIRERQPVQVSHPLMNSSDQSLSLKKSGLIIDANHFWGAQSDELTFTPTSKQYEANGKGEFSEIYVYPLPREYVDIQQNELIRHFQSAGMHARQGLGVRYKTRVTEIERRYLVSPPLTDLDSCPEETKSKVHLLTKNKVFHIGDSISIRVDLHDQRGRIRTQGGDDVRMVLKNSKTCSTPAKVTDMGNGSYLGTVNLHCTGEATLSVFLKYPREFLRLAVELRHVLLSMRHLTAKFKNSQGKIIETTPCLPSLPIPGYSSTCNLTEANGQAPYYCGHPTNAILSCASPFQPGVMRFYQPVLRGADQQLSELINKKDNFRRIPNNITLRIKKGVKRFPESPCWSRPPIETWNFDWHQGWLENKRWHSESCLLPPALNRGLLVRCLRNVTLVLVGDSNARLMYQAVTTTLGFPKQTSGWHKPRIVEIKCLNSTIIMVPHARPFFPGGQKEQETLSTEQLFPALPPNRLYVIVLHYWAHFTLFPLVTYRDRLRQARLSVEKLLQKQPTAKVFLQGPHSFHKNKGQREDIGDFFGPWVKRIAWEEFRGLHNRVGFLDFWPLSVASGVKNVHPPRCVVQEMTRVLMGYACATH